MLLPVDTVTAHNVQRMKCLPADKDMIVNGGNDMKEAMWWKGEHEEQTAQDDRIVQEKT